jgi:hypothetical protein
VRASDQGDPGDITGVSVDPASGLSGGGDSGDVALSLLKDCSAGQVLKWNGASWACADDSDTDTNAGGDITAVTTSVGTGLVGGAMSGEASLSLLTSCAAGQLLKWSGNGWECAADADTGDITAVTTAAGTGLTGGVTGGDASLSLLTSCGAGQLLKWSGSAWACASDVDTNSGGDITDVVAGTGLLGGASTGSAALNVGAGTGIIVGADSVGLDVSFTDARYLNTTGGTMTGALNMGGQRISNRGCPPGYVSAGAGLCIELNDECCFTFSAASNRCRAAGTHLCTSAEMRAVMMSGIALGSGGISLDWLADQDADDSALFVNNAADPQNPDGARAANTSSYARCCASIE